MCNHMRASSSYSNSDTQVTLYGKTNGPLYKTNLGSNLFCVVLISIVGERRRSGEGVSAWSV